MIIAINGTRYSNCFERIEWGGDTKGSARYLEATSLPLQVSAGDKVEFYNQIGKRLFIGRVFRVEKNTDTDTVTFKAFDNAIYLNKNSFVKNFYEQTPSEISKIILGEINIPAGDFPQDKLKCTFPAIDRTGYDIMIIAYTMQNAKDNKVYSVVSEDEKISVVEQGTLIGNYLLDSAVNIRSATYSTNIEEMVNKVLIYKTDKENAQIIGTQQNDSDISKYGIFQVVQQQTEENKALVDTQKIMKGISEYGRLTVDGMNDLVSGYSVAVSVSNLSELAGTFLISTDTHIWEHDDYYCELELDFENAMSRIEIDQYEKKKKKQNDPQVSKVGQVFKGWVND